MNTRTQYVHYKDNEHHCAVQTVSCVWLALFAHFEIIMANGILFLQIPRTNMTNLQRDVSAVFQAAVAAVAPEALVRGHIHVCICHFIDLIAFRSPHLPLSSLETLGSHQSCLFPLT